MNCNTQKGLYFIIIGSIITMICSIITSISNFFTKDTAISMIISIFGIVSFIGVILSLIGVILFFMGRKEFGEKHQKNIKNAVIIFVIAFIVIVSVIAIFIASVIFSTITTISSTDSNTSLAAPTSLLVIVVSIVGAVLGGLIYYFALIELEDKTGKKILYAGIVTSIAISIVTSFYLAGMFSGLFSSISTGSRNFSALPFTQSIGKIGILGIIPNLLYLYSFYIPYKRIKDGEIVPVVSSVDQGPLSSRICPNCGRSIPFDANSCPYCSKDFLIRK
jgi:uncharacterized membrane protein